LFLKQYAVFRFNRFEIGLFAKHDPHLDFDTARNKRDRNIIRAPPNGFDEFSPTFSSETKTQPTTTLNGTFNQAVQCPVPAAFPKS